MAHENTLTKITLTGSYARNKRNRKSRSKNTPKIPSESINIATTQDNNNENIPLKFFTGNLSTSNINTPKINTSNITSIAISSSLEANPSPSTAKFTPIPIKPREPAKLPTIKTLPIKNSNQYPDTPPATKKIKNKKTQAFSNSIKNLLADSPVQYPDSDSYFSSSDDLYTVKDTSFKNYNKVSKSSEGLNIVTNNNNIKNIPPGSQTLNQQAVQNTVSFPSPTTNSLKSSDNALGTKNISIAYMKLCETLNSLDSKFSSRDSNLEIENDNLVTLEELSLAKDIETTAVSNQKKTNNVQNLSQDKTQKNTQILDTSNKITPNAVEKNSSISFNELNKTSSTRKSAHSYKNLNPLPSINTLEKITNSNSKLNNSNSALDYPPNQFTIDRNTIQDFEKKANPEFFSKSLSNTPERYIKIRNYILNKWDEFKPYYLNKFNSRNGLTGCGDVNIISRIHTWLEKIKAINSGQIVNNPHPNSSAAKSRSRHLSPSSKRRISADLTSDYTESPIKYPKNNSTSNTSAPNSTE
ncbi:Histone H2A deubiquitinase MYSM1 [Smittium culicis]|uniref:Histone H2A deubiquitinase MYSM1 n=1 Tax=Smittium culicis TaxID=133412 RepID=A0A1R1Y9U0_9FUNG|nr:Histone H2A deubiquitinase MYSM1 [Smittium culicis]